MAALLLLRDQGLAFSGDPPTGRRGPVVRSSGRRAQGRQPVQPSGTVSRVIAQVARRSPFGEACQARVLRLLRPRGCRVGPSSKNRHPGKSV